MISKNIYFLPDGEIARLIHGDGDFPFANLIKNLIIQILNTFIMIY